MKPESLPLIIETTALDALLPDDKLLLVAVTQQQVFLQHHLPNSVLVEPAELVSGIKPAVGKLPTPEQLSALFSRLGLTPDRHIVAYDDEGGGWAGRLIWTLDVIGHRHYSYLNGGLVAWLGDGLPVASGSAQARHSNYTARIQQEQLVNMAGVLGQIGDPDSIVWDARSPEEYTGSKITTARNGHIPGAINLDWLELIDRDNHLRLLPLSTIAGKLRALGVDKSKRLITHCQTHHRSGLTYLAGKALGLDIKAYDGSWSEWGNQMDTPIETGTGRA